MTNYDSPVYPDADAAFSASDNLVQPEEVVMDCLHMLAASLDLTSAIDSFLETLGCYYEADQIWLFQLDFARQLSKRTAGWQNNFLYGSTKDAPVFPLEIFENWLEALAWDGILFEPSVPSDIGAHLNLRPQDCVLAAPLHVNANITGMLCVVNPKLHAGDTQVLLAVSSLTVVELRKLELMQEINQLRCRPDTHRGVTYLETLVQRYQNTAASAGVLMARIQDLQTGDAGADPDSAILQSVSRIMHRTLATDIHRMEDDTYLVILPNTDYTAFAQSVEALRRAFVTELPYDMIVGHAWADGGVDLRALFAAADKQLTL